MIEVINREILIPREEYNIGTCYDDNTETRHFHLKRVTSSGIDLAALTFNLDVKYANGQTDAASLLKEVTDKDINLTLTISNSMLQVPGTVIIQIRALEEDGTCKWTSYQSAFFVEDHINTPGHYQGGLTQLEQYEAEWGKVRDNVNQLNSRMDQIAAMKDGYPGDSDLAAEVLDARVGADNVTYSSLGRAIRTQAERLKSKIDDIDSITYFFPSNLNFSNFSSYINTGYANGITSDDNYYYYATENNQDVTGIIIHRINKDKTVKDSMNIPTIGGINDIDYYNGELWIACGSSGLYKLTYNNINSLVSVGLPNTITKVMGIAVTSTLLAIADDSKPQKIYFVNKETLTISDVWEDERSYNDKSQTLSGGLDYYNGVFFKWQGKPNSIIGIYKNDLSKISEISLLGGDSDYAELEGVDIESDGRINVIVTNNGDYNNYVNKILVSNIYGNGCKENPYIYDLSNPKGNVANYININYANNENEQDGSLQHPYASFASAYRAIKRNPYINIIRLHSEQHTYHVPDMWSMSNLHIFNRKNSVADLLKAFDIYDSTMHFERTKFDCTEKTIFVRDSFVIFNNCAFNGAALVDAVTLYRSIAIFNNCTFENTQNNIVVNNDSIVRGITDKVNLIDGINLSHLDFVSGDRIDLNGYPFLSGVAVGMREIRCLLPLYKNVNATTATFTTLRGMITYCNGTKIEQDVTDTSFTFSIKLINNVGLEIDIQKDTTFDGISVNQPVILRLNGVIAIT